MAHVEWFELCSTNRPTQFCQSALRCCSGFQTCLMRSSCCCRTCFSPSRIKSWEFPVHDSKKSASALGIQVGSCKYLFIKESSCLLLVQLHSLLKTHKQGKCMGREEGEELLPFTYKLKKNKKTACLVENKLVQFWIHVFIVQTFSDSDVKCASGLLCVLFSFSNYSWENTGHSLSVPSSRSHGMHNKTPILWMFVHAWIDLHSLGFFMHVIIHRIRASGTVQNLCSYIYLGLEFVALFWHKLFISFQNSLLHSHQYSTGQD